MSPRCDAEAARRSNRMAAVWGFAEATLFFVVPDVWLSYVALRSRRTAFVACLFATGGALVGGAAMYGWGRFATESANAAILAVPAVGAPMVERVAADLADGGPTALFVGPFMGTPYKIYATQAPAAGIGLLRFLAVSIPARLLRFVLVSAIVGTVATRVFGGVDPRRKTWILTGFWVVFYTLFWLLMPS